MSISKPLELLAVIEAEVREAVAMLQLAQARLLAAGRAAVSVAEAFDSSLARLSMVEELAKDYDEVKAMRERVVERTETSIKAIREAVGS